MSFFIFAFIFGAIYYFSNVIGIELIENLSPEKIHLNTTQLIFRSFYFSIVTMTTLGFGDMFAHTTSIAGYILLTIQVIIGYIILGALITRLSILFMTGGPAIIPDKIEKKS